MLDREHFIHFPFVDPVSWARRYGIEPASADCYRCGAETHTCIAIACGELRGLIAPLCSCGHPNPPYCLVRANGGCMVDYLLGK
jgi:hypothetical protein